jgi:hypothetical protein
VTYWDFAANWEQRNFNYFRLFFPSSANKTGLHIPVEYRPTISPWPESVSELYRPSDRRLLAKSVPTFADRGCHVVSVTDPYGRIFGYRLTMLYGNWTCLRVFCSEMSSLRISARTLWSEGVLENLLDTFVHKRASLVYSRSQINPPQFYFFMIFLILLASKFLQTWLLNVRTPVISPGCFTALHTSSSWRWSRYFAPKHLNFSELHVTTHEDVVFILIRKWRRDSIIDPGNRSAPHPVCFISVNLIR